MDKKLADKVIGQYTKKIFGFACNKTRNLQEAEELASQITMQVYISLLRKKEIQDINSYIYRISHNVWTHYLEKNATTQSVSIQDYNLHSNDNTEEEYISSETKGMLRREIAYLSKTRRNIVMDFYYNDLSLNNIASKRNLSIGTVKWYLHQCKKELKKGMKKIRNIGKLGIVPIKLVDMGHSGRAGKKGDTKDFLSNSLTQNVAYACYHKARTINEVALELGVSPVYIEDEIETLYEYGFLNKLTNASYQTIMLIDEYTQEYHTELNEIFMKYAVKLIDQYILKLFPLEDKFKNSSIYYPDNDFNLLLWTLIPYLISTLKFDSENEISFDDVAIIRKDGGKYISFASIAANNIKYNKELSVCGPMIMNNKSNQQNIETFRLITYWNQIEKSWRDNHFNDYKLLAHFIQGELPPNDLNAENYQRLIEKQFLIKENDQFKVNIVYAKNKNDTNLLKSLLPKKSEEIRKLSKEIANEVFTCRKAHYPSHMLDTVNFICRYSLTYTSQYVLKEMLNRKLITIPKNDRSKSMSTLLMLSN